MASSFALGERFERLIDDLIDSGDYNNRSEVVRDALRQLERRRLTFANLDRMHQEGVASGRSIPADEAFADIREQVGIVRKSNNRDCPPAVSQSKGATSRNR